MVQLGVSCRHEWNYFEIEMKIYWKKATNREVVIVRSGEVVSNFTLILVFIVGLE